jgi:hypothetical protein
VPVIDVPLFDVLRSASNEKLADTFVPASTATSPAVFADTSPAVFADTSPALSTPSLLPNGCFKVDGCFVVLMCQ